MIPLFSNYAAPFGQKKSEYFLIRIFWIGRDPPPFWPKVKKNSFFMAPLRRQGLLRAIFLLTSLIVFLFSGIQECWASDSIHTLQASTAQPGMFFYATLFNILSSEFWSFFCFRWYESNSNTTWLGGNACSLQVTQRLRFRKFSCFEILFFFKSGLFFSAMCSIPKMFRIKSRAGTYSSEIK